MIYENRASFVYSLRTIDQVIIMNLNKLTLKSQEALQTAQDIAASYNNQTLEPIHLLAALLQDAEGIVPPLV